MAKDFSLDQIKNELHYLKIHYVDIKKTIQDISTGIISFYFRNIKNNIL